MYSLDALFILLFGLMNLLGGHWDEFDPGTQTNGRAFFRAMLPGIVSGFLAYTVYADLNIALNAYYAVGIGSILWFMPGWSFDEITGAYDPNKYPLWLRRFGLWAVPGISSPKSNRLRGVIVKGVRGGFDIVTFAALYSVNHVAPWFYLGTFLMGAVYWLCGRLVRREAAVYTSEFYYGCMRGALIAAAITWGVHG